MGKLKWCSKPGGLCPANAPLSEKRPWSYPVFPVSSQSFSLPVQKQRARLWWVLRHWGIKHILYSLAYGRSQVLGRIWDSCVTEVSWSINCCINPPEFINHFACCIKLWVMGFPALERRKGLLILEVDSSVQSLVQGAKLRFPHPQGCLSPCGT